MKICPKCKIQKDLSEYWKTCSYCKDCQKAHWRMRYYKDKPSFAERDRLKWEKKHAHACLKCGKMIIKHGSFCSLKCKILGNIKKKNKCWIWQGTLNSTGYGHSTWEGKHILIHRASFKIFKGEIPNGKYICHNCPKGDNPQCCNPDHLFLGSPKENMEDAKSKGNLRNRILNEDKVKEIKKLIREKKEMREIATQFGVKIYTIHDIKYGKSWKLVKE